MVRVGSTKNIFFGHDHAINSSVLYKGVRLTFSLKSGKGAGYESALQGGTVIDINSKGECSFKHVYCV